MHHKTVSEFIPDYYATRVIKWRWLIYPWAQVEDISGFIAEMKPCPDTVHDIAAQLKASYGIQVPNNLLEYVISTQEGVELHES